MSELVLALHLTNGAPDGPRILDCANRNTLAVHCARAQVPGVLEWEDLKRPGVYVLLFEPVDAADNRQRIYIGEADELARRLKQHFDKEEEKGTPWNWNQAFLFTSKDTGLNKAYALHLQAQLYSRAIRSGLAILLNGNEPSLPNLSRADRASAEGFLEDVLLYCPVLGLFAFEEEPERSSLAGKVLLVCEGKGVRATGRLLKDGLAEKAFVVYAGSTAVAEEVPSLHDFIRVKRQELLKDGTMVKEGDHLKFTKDWTSTSPSNAASVVQGHPAGLKFWRDDRNRPLDVILSGGLSRPGD